jgi:hypothetical protein
MFHWFHVIKCQIIHILSLFTEHAVHISYAWSDVILCIVWHHISRVHLILLSSVQCSVYFLYRNSYKSYSIYTKYVKKTDMKSEMHNLRYSPLTYFNCDVILFCGFYTRQKFPKQALINIPAWAVFWVVFIKVWLPNS